MSGLSLNLHYEERGEGRHLVFLHGFGTNTYAWKHLIPGLRIITKLSH